MTALHELQRSFRTGLLGREVAAAAGLVVADRLAPERRFQIYRNHVRVTLTDALAATYPVVRRLVGEAFFSAVAARYIAVLPPRSPCLFEYGADFGAFLGALPEARHLPYLADVAHLEWAINEAYHAPDVPALTPERLAELARLRGERLHLVLDPSVRLLASPYPIAAIWEANRPEQAEVPPVDLGQGGVRLLIRRRDLDVVWRELDPAEHAFLSALERGFTVADAIGKALASGSFDAQAALERLLDDGVLADLPTTLA